MFYYLKGELALLDTNFCVIDCGGVGYQLTVSLITAESLSSKVGKEAKLFTTLAVREDGVELFGFGTPEEKNAYMMLTGVSGVGPKAAMAVLSIMTPDKLALAVATEDIKGISKAQNIGKKTAARIVLELKDKIAQDLVIGRGDAGATIEITAPHASSSNLSEAREALMVLGYDKTTVLNALKSIDPSLDPGTIIKLALKKLAR